MCGYDSGTGEQGLLWVQEVGRVLGMGNSQGCDSGVPVLWYPSSLNLCMVPPKGRGEIPEAQEARWPPHQPQKDGQLLRVHATLGQPVTEHSHLCDPAGCPPFSCPQGLGCHLRELRQLEGLADAAGQSGHVLLPEAALVQPEGRRPGAELVRPVWATGRASSWASQGPTWWGAPLMAEAKGSGLQSPGCFWGEIPHPARKC